MLANDVFGKYKLALAIGLLTGFYNNGRIVTSLIYLPIDVPLFKVGFATV